MVIEFRVELRELPPKTIEIKELLPNLEDGIPGHEEIVASDAVFVLGRRVTRRRREKVHQTRDQVDFRQMEQSVVHVNLR